MLRVRFIGTSSGDYEFKPYDLIGEVIKNCTCPCNIFYQQSALSIMNLKLMFCDIENFRNLILLLKFLEFCSIKYSVHSYLRPRKTLNLLLGKIGSSKVYHCLASRGDGLISNSPELVDQSGSSLGQMEISVLYTYYTVCCIFVFTNIFKNE